VNIEVVSAPKTQADFDTLIDEVNGSEFISQLPPAELHALIGAGTARFFYDGEAIAGVGAWEVFGARWSEVGPFYILRAYRSKGLGHLVFDTITEINLEQGRRLYGVTKNPVVKRMFERAGFRQVRIYALPVRVLFHLLGKLTPGTVFHGLRKLKRHQSIAHFVKTARMPASGV
jgi:GNAT superfamily N-acetyltransferase